jgi:hypothetical protein
MFICLLSDLPSFAGSVDDDGAAGKPWWICGRIWDCRPRPYMKPKIRNSG